MRAQTSGGRCARRRGVHQCTHLIRVTERAFDDFAGGRHRRRGQPPYSWLELKRVEEWLSEHPGKNPQRGRIRIGMVGGGQGAFIGAVHRIALRLDDQYELVAGALSSDPARAKASAREIGIADDRAYTSFEEMAKAEAKRPDGIEAVSIVTPNHMHGPAAKAFLKAGIHVICDKPLTTTVKEAQGTGRAGGKDRQALRPHPQLHRLSDDAAGASAMVAKGVLGDIRSCRRNIRRTG